MYDTGDLIGVDPIGSCACCDFRLDHHSTLVPLFVLHSFVGNGQEGYSRSLRANKKFSAGYLLLQLLNVYVPNFKSTEHSHSWKANSSAASQKLPAFYRS
jgi:hypothetical protein